MRIVYLLFLKVSNLLYRRMYSKRHNITTIGFQGRYLTPQGSDSPYFDGMEKGDETSFLESFGKIKICKSMQDIVENSGFFTEESKRRFIFE